jgi:hypothetical protein
MTQINTYYAKASVGKHMDTDLVLHINQSLEIELPVSVSQQELRGQLAAHINYLINHDFEKLVFYLYRIDVDETKMRRLLEQREGENAAGLIADLIIEREVQKMESRKKFDNQKKEIREEEKW